MARELCLVVVSSPNTRRLSSQAGCFQRFQPANCAHKDCLQQKPPSWIPGVREILLGGNIRLVANEARKRAYGGFLTFADLVPDRKYRTDNGCGKIRPISADSSFPLMRPIGSGRLSVGVRPTWTELYVFQFT